MIKNKQNKSKKGEQIMKTLDYIGFNAGDAAKTVDELQKLLANMQVFYANLRNFHWNVRTDQFFTLHAKYEEMYNDANDKIDELAERILALSGVPKSKFSDYLKISQVKESDTVHCPQDGVETTLDNLKLIIAQERKVQKTANASGDEVTDDMMTEYLTGQEKNVWMLVAYATTLK